MQYDEAGQLVARNGLQLGRIDTIAIDGDEAGAHGYGADLRVSQMAADGTLVLYGFDRFELRDGVATTFVTIRGDRVARRESTDLAVSVYGDGNNNGAVDAGDAWLAAQAGDGLSTAHVLAAAASRMLVGAEDATAFLHVDHLGSLVASSDADGEVRGLQAFMLHGAVRGHSGFVGHYGFTGQERDATTGFVHMQFRELDPATGRWDRFDPAFVRLDPGAMSRFGECSTGYAYVANNPSSAVDPSGLGKLFRDLKAKVKSGLASGKRYRKRKWKGIQKTFGHVSKHAEGGQAPALQAEAKHLGHVEGRGEVVGSIDLAIAPSAADADAYAKKSRYQQVDQATGIAEQAWNVVNMSSEGDTHFGYATPEQLNDPRYIDPTQSSLARRQELQRMDEIVINQEDEGKHALF